MAHGALYARYSPATVAEAPAWAFAPAPCPLEKTKPRALYWRRGPPPVPVHALVWPPPRGAESAHILLVLCSLCEARRRCYALTGTLGNSYTYLPRFCSPRVRTLFTFRCGSTGVRAGHEVSTPDCKPVSSCHMPWIASRTFGGSVRFGLVRFPLDGQTRCHPALIQSPGFGGRARRVSCQPPYGQQKPRCYHPCMVTLGKLPPAPLSVSGKAPAA